MIFNDLLSEKGFTVYSLSALSGIPKTTLTDISSGKVELLDCSGRTLQKLASSLGVTIEELLQLERNEAKELFPKFLADSIHQYQKALRKRSTMLDCYLDQLNSSINVAETENLISKEMANRLRKRYFEPDTNSEIIVKK